MDPRAEPERRPVAKLFVGTLATVALSFIAVSAYSQYAQHAIDGRARDISGNAAPSVQHLTTARGEMRHLQVLLDRFVASGGGAEARAAVARSRAELQAEIDAYLELPTFPGEREVWDHVSLSLRHLDGAVEELLSSVRGGDLPAARQRMAQEVPAAVDEASESISRSIEFNARIARDTAVSIASLHRRSRAIEFALDGVSAVLALGAALLVYRWARGYTALLREYGALTRDRADELEQFAGRVAHDILSPLNSTSIALGMVAPLLEGDARGGAAVERGLHGVQRVQRIVHGLLEFARAGARPAPGAHAELKTVIDDVASAELPAAREARIELSVGPIAPAAVACSEGVLTSLVENLVHNAVKYMGEGKERRIRVQALDAGPRVRVEVIDTGQGIPEQLQSRVFQPYVRGASAQPGIGLGLATVKRIAESHGGAVGLQSAPGHGALFWVELPKARGEAAERAL